MSGQFGFGPDASYWQQFIQPDKLTASIEFSGYKGTKFGTGDTVYDFFTTFGAQIDYNSNVTRAHFDASVTQIYNFDTFGFGVVYVTDNVPQSSYIVNSTANTKQVIFDTNTVGLALPTSMFNEWVSLMSNITDSMTCAG